MTTIIVAKIKRWTPILQVVILALGTLLSFITSYINGNVNMYLPFISETGAYSPAKCIFSLFLIIGSFIGCVMIFFVYLTYSSVSETQVKYCMNLITCIIGINSMFGLAGVAAFPMTTVFWAHLVAATLYFLGSTVYFICITFITMKIYGRSKILKLRFVLSGAIVILLILISIVFPISLKRWHEKNSGIPALKEPKDEGFDLLFISSILEWSIVSIIIIFTVSFINELKSKTIIISVRPEEIEKDTTAEEQSGMFEETQFSADFLEKSQI